jgi:FkbH-like protein
MTATADVPGRTLAEDPAVRLSTLHSAGLLAAEYPAVRALLADMSGPDLVRAGRLLASVRADEVRDTHPNVPAVTIAITGHGTLSALIPPLTAELARHGVVLRPRLCEFDSYVFDLSDPDSDLYTADPDIVLCVLDPGVVLDEVPVPWRPDDVARVLREKVALLDQLAGRFGRRASGTLVLNTVPLPHGVLAQLVDHRSRAALGALWREANAALLRLAETHPSVVVLDLDSLVTEGIAVTDPRLSVYAKAHLSAELLARYAREIGHLARNSLGLTKKCLVLDLDETVWGGVLGDDGIDGIEVAGSYRGEAFRAMQKVAKQLAAQGVLLAAVSKNDLEPVQAVLREHREMTLREDDFVRVVANWRPKPDNLTELAGDLNLGVDAFVFVDDNPAECGLMRYRLPEVAVVQLDTEPAHHVRGLLRDGWFDSRQLTKEDSERPARYREELVRKDFLRGFASVEGYLEQLDIRVRLAVAEQHEVPRLSQITLRTNQFNLTTERMQEADVAAVLAAPNRTALVIHVRDRFGDNGLVGAILLTRDRDTVHIDNFLLSCRVFSRGIEQACLTAVLRHARETGATEVIGRYRPTEKNRKVARLYPTNGFTTLVKNERWSVFRHDLAEIEPAPAHLHLTEQFEGSPA